MFYLSEVYKLIRTNTFSTAVFFVLAVSLIVVSANTNTFEKKIADSLPKIENAHYFNALIDKKVNIESVSRKIRELPGVQGTEVVSDKKKATELKALQSQMNLTQAELTELSKNRTLKIILHREVSQNSIKLIREYMTRLSGEGHIVLGSVKQRISNESGFKALLLKVQSWPIQFVLCVLALVWLVSAFVVRKNILKQAYIVESFQRRENVAFKTFLSLLISCVVVSALASFVINKPNIYILASSSIIMILFTFSVIGKKNWISA